MAFQLFDKDDNGDATREEVELACLDVHRELLSLSASMKDIDSAVGRLDNIFMSLYFVVAALIMAVSLFIRNHRRSGPESEPFEMDVAYDTTFEKIEELRAKMLAFVESRRRDFQPVFDISVLDLPGQEKMVLKADIKYKSNNHLGALKAKRRNMWICCLKQSMSEVGIFGPSGDPNAASGPTKYTLVPWEEVNRNDTPPAEGGGGTIKEPLIPRTDFNLADKNAALKDSADDIWGEGSELNLTNPKQMPTRPTVLPSSSTGPRSRARANTRRATAEEYEMRPGGPGGPQ
ncbi:hypothetical protein FRC00_011332 [Tulasnella sp. 408]|nr:hypothetical protein FRC00_011332 [Tulasnella sp. 408]